MFQVRATVTKPVSYETGNALRLVEWIILFLLGWISGHGRQKVGQII
jgi:hypothetical protein